MTGAGSVKMVRNYQILGMLWRCNSLLIHRFLLKHYRSVREVSSGTERHQLYRSLPPLYFGNITFLKNKLRQHEWHTFETLIKVMDLLPENWYSWLQLIWVPPNSTHRVSKIPLIYWTMCGFQKSKNIQETD